MLQISMATASPSPLAPSTETTNGVKLRRLLVDGGTTALRAVFDSFHPPTKLAANLHLNNSTLDDLFARGFLTEQQRKLLFPSDGSKPDSKTFDISLLFHLLTEICGLSPAARTGWNHKPQAKNKSPAAKLVRIKLFRNKLLHTPETRIDTGSFDKLWKEISGVLVSLGLDQAEINRLKAERCGKEDYLDILLQWADREKEMKLKLEEVCQNQTKMLKAVEEQQKIFQDTKTAVETVCQTQQEQQKIFQDTKLAVGRAAEKVCQTQQEQQKLFQDTKLAVETAAEKVCQTQQEQQKLFQDTKLAVETAAEKVCQTQQEQQKLFQDTKLAVETAAEKVCQTQQEQQKIFQDTKLAVETAAEKVCQTQQEQQKIFQDTKLAVETAAEKVCHTQQEHRALLQDANAKLEQAHETQQNTKSKLETIHQSAAKTRKTVERVYHTQLEDHETLQDNKSKLDNLRQTQAKTQDTVERLRQTQLVDRETVANVVKIQEELVKSVEEISQKFDSLKERKDEDEPVEVLRNLAKSEFKSDIEYLVGRYQEGTREWVFNEVENWLDDRNSENRVMVISSNAGMGKSVVSAVICKRMQGAGRLSGATFVSITMLVTEILS